MFVDKNEIISKISLLKKKRKAIILAHYYQNDDIQEIADFVGDSLELSLKAIGTTSDVIVFCGVKFMAETAKILNQNKVILLPDFKAGCSLEISCKANLFEIFKRDYQDHLVLMYINSSVEAKALSDIIVTSANAEKIINSIPKTQKIIFAPDKNLGHYLSVKTNREMILWPGLCVVHENFSWEHLEYLIDLYPKAHILAHPECNAKLLTYANYISSTSGLINYVKSKLLDDFIILTEPGVIYQMKKVSPNSSFHLVNSLDNCCNKCSYMRLNTLEKLYLCLEKLSPQIEIPDAIAVKARCALNRMLEY